MLAQVQWMTRISTIVCLHGKLPINEIDDRMMSFVEGTTDVLLATDVVESSINVRRAGKHDRGLLARERFGLPQLRRLQGKGRARWDTCVCVLVDQLGGGATEKRLAVLEEFNRPGAGFLPSVHGTWT